MRYNLAIPNFDITECERSVIIICTNTHLYCFLILFVEAKNIIVIPQIIRIACKSHMHQLLDKRFLIEIFYVDNCFWIKLSS